MLDHLETIATGLDHPEGVAWGPDGRLYAGGEAGQVYAVDADGRVEEIASTGGFMYGVTLDGDGNVYACDFGRAEIALVTPGGSVSSYSTGTTEHRIRVPNFTAFDDQGNLFLTDSGTWGADDGLLFKVSAGRDRGMVHRGAGIPERVLSLDRRRRPARGRVEPASGRERADPIRRLGGRARAGGRPHRVTARWHRPRRRRHDVRRVLPARSGLAHPTRRQAGGSARRSRRGVAEPTGERRVHGTRARRSGDLEPRWMEHRRPRCRSRRTPPAVPEACPDMIGRDAQGPLFRRAVWGRAILRRLRSDRRLRPGPTNPARRRRPASLRRGSDRRPATRPPRCPGVRTARHRLRARR